MLSLLRGHPFPDTLFRGLVRPLLRSHTIPLIELLADLVLLFRRHSLESRAVLEEPLPLRRRHLAHALHPRPRCAHSQLLPWSQIPACPIVRANSRSWICPINRRRLPRRASLTHWRT